MKDIINLITWTPEMGKRTIDKDDVDYDNKRIAFYNSLKLGSKEKKITGEYLKMCFAKPIGEILGVDLGEPLKDELTDEEKILRRRLAREFKELKDIIINKKGKI